MQENKQLNIGVIGMGKMGLLHASIMNTIPGVRLSAMYDTSRVLKRFARKALNGILVTDNIDEFAGLKYDAIYITTPIPTHYSIARDMYSMGVAKNIFVEKTLTSSYEQSVALCREAEAASGVNMVGYMSRFAPTFRKARELLQEETIGKPVSFKAYAYASDFAGVRSKSMPARGGATRDLGAHVIDLSLWFFGDLEVEPTSPGPAATEVTGGGSCFKVRSSNGLTGEFDISWCKAGYRLPEFGLFITGSKGAIKVNADLVKLEKAAGEVITWHRQDLHDSVSFLLGAAEYYCEDEHFVKAVREGGSAEPDFNTASKVDLLIEQVECQTDK